MRFDTRKTRDQQQPPNYFSRREQYRLLALVFALGIAFWAMRKAADPTTWGWFVGDPVATASEHGHSTQEDHEIDTRRDAYEPLPQDFFRVPPPAATAQSGPSSAFPGVDPNWLAILQDDTVFRSAETEAWYGMLNLARQASTDDLAAHSVGRVGFTQLYQQPDSYRGRSIELSGVVRRCHHIDAHSNNEGIEGYYRCWLWPHGSSNPVVLYCLQMPAGFPTGMSIDEPATVRGLFYKRWAYKAVKDIRIAPLVIANTIKWQPRPQGARTMPPRQHLLGWGYDRTPCLGAGFLDGGLGLQLLQAQHLTASRDRPAEYDRYLKLFELSPPHSLKLADGSEITPTEAVVLQRSLEAVSRLPDHLAARWQDYGVTFEQILTDPAAHRCRLISLQGRLKSIVPTAHPVAQAETETIYRAMIEVPEGDHIQLLDLYTPHVPSLGNR